jgi:hypothetical protein
MLLAKFDPVLDQTGSADGGPKIRNLSRFLDENEQRLQTREHFLEVFVSQIRDRNDLNATQKVFKS